MLALGGYLHAKNKKKSGITKISVFPKLAIIRSVRTDANFPATFVKSCIDVGIREYNKSHQQCK
jgi:hypothetical protein